MFALNSYSAQFDDELSFKKGDEVLVISEQIVDEGYAYAEVFEKRGVVPTKFLSENKPVDEALKLRKGNRTRRTVKDLAAIFEQKHWKLLMKINDI